MMKGEQLLLYFLFEHKSAEDRFTGFQLLKYMVRIWEQYQAQNKNSRHLPVIIPQVIYHGKKKWTLDTNFISLFKETSQLETFVPNFRYSVYDISHIPDEAIKGEVVLQICLKALKYTYSSQFYEKLGEILTLFHQLSNKSKATEYLEVLLRYVYETKEISVEELHKSLEQSYKTGGATMATLAEKLRQEGRLEGRQEERKERDWVLVRNALSEGLSMDTIARVTRLSINKIKEMKAKIEGEIPSSQSCQ